MTSYKPLIALILAATCLAACDNPPPTRKWWATGTVLSVTADCPGGWQGCHSYSVVFMEDKEPGFQRGGDIYTLGKVYGPPPVWEGFHGWIEEESNSESSGRVIIARQERQ